MGKSPGKWIKTVLFGKKNSKSNLSKNVTPDKESAAKTPVEDPAGNSPVISYPSRITDRDAENIELEKGKSDIPYLGVDSQSNNGSVPLSDAEIQSQEQAATKAQAAFRGYLARRAFWALKGIIRLQALIRGHLVRRQAVATLRCMQAIVKLQALARGEKDAILVGIGANSFFAPEKLATNAFVRKLITKLPAAMPLSLQYDVAEPNSAWNWLERWSLSHFWEPRPKIKKISNGKPHKKQGSAPIVESEPGKSRRTTRIETDKPKRNPRKNTSHQMDFVQEQAQNELERVKRSLRKVTASEKPETEIEQPQNSEQDIVLSSENEAVADVIVEKLPSPEVPSETKTTDEPVDLPHGDHPVVETPCSENGEKTEESIIISHDEHSGKNENENTKKRRSLPAKQEYTENISQNTPRLPSYMAATKSAQAKLKAQGSSKFGEDGGENGNLRRHSLPASTNGKLSALSPRIQKPVQANGKAGNKTNKLLTTSRDDKTPHPGWRR
ncbi:hypothetical protein ACJIZ3_007975 [Penstemon smallii]|uniref:DUF4005 domain-containing protein n=1 Tax=Penstemon smallii TaxID=265156 RepID=A0ABD3T8G7_9LAMI